MGASVDEPALLAAINAAVALRWVLARDVIVGVEDGTPLRRGSRPDESGRDAMDELVALTELVFEAADVTA